jgi:hypothetical protein
MNSSEIIKTQMTNLQASLKQAAQSADGVQAIDLGSAEELRDLLNSVIEAKLQAQQQGGKSKAAGAAADESDTSTKKKSNW